MIYLMYIAIAIAAIYAIGFIFVFSWCLFENDMLSRKLSFGFFGGLAWPWVIVLVYEKQKRDKK